MWESSRSSALCGALRQDRRLAPLWAGAGKRLPSPPGLRGSPHRRGADGPRRREGLGCLGLPAVQPRVGRGWGPRSPMENLELVRGVQRVAELAQLSLELPAVEQIIDSQNGLGWGRP